MKINWKQKLTSRKFWAAVAGFAASIALALGYSENTVSLVAGTVMAGASCIAYILGEGPSTHTGPRPEKARMNDAGAK